MNPAEAAAWTAAIVAIVAAIISFVTMGIACWQAVSARKQAASAVAQSLSARRSADVAEQALIESRKQTKASQKSALAAEQQAAEAKRQNLITEEQLRIAQSELEANQNNYHEKQKAKYVAMIHQILLDADALRDELKENAAAAILWQQRKSDKFGIPPLPPVMLSRAGQDWHTAVNKVRVDKPPSPALTAAIDKYDIFAKESIAAIDMAYERADSRQLSRPQVEALAATINKRDTNFEALKAECNRFFADHGVDPSDLTAH
ncbi:hypothetical protein [Amycolatopsis sp. WAC 04197]|uniref:hypothetical protein n=1 Tax=Amycolatopsis sp. WAC 04197 TaxID=2203199 RepID=UPI000F78E090|nr:hypothetical protein [Amycolatopsis sp. WAC 04197]